MGKTWRRDDESDKRSGKENFNRTDRWSNGTEMSDKKKKDKSKAKPRSREDAYEGIFS